MGDNIVYLSLLYTVSIAVVLRLHQLGDAIRHSKIYNLPLFSSLVRAIVNCGHLDGLPFSSRTPIIVNREILVDSRKERSKSIFLV